MKNVKMTNRLANTNTNNSITTHESSDDFRPGATIAVVALLLAFVLSSVYILITGYLNIA
jgi:uncharacterized membrane protein (DUF485 family)